MRMLKILTTVSLLATTAFAATATQAAHRHYGHEKFVSAVQNFEHAARRLRQAIHRHGGHVYIAHKANRLTRAARQLRRSAQHGAPPPRLRYKLNVISSEFRGLRRAFRKDRHLKHDRHVARSFRNLRYAHERLHRINRWVPDRHRRPRENAWYFSMSF